MGDPKREGDLRRVLDSIDGSGYKAYRDLRGSYELSGCTLHVDHVQGDPFAAPSKVRVRVAQDVAELPPELLRERPQRIALADFLARRIRREIGAGGSERRGSGKSGAIRIDAGGQEVLERTAVVFGDDWVEARLEIGLPAAGRRVLGRQAEAMLCGDLPRIAEAALHFPSLPETEARRFVACVENQEAIRASLAEKDLVAFVADGSILPRESGASDRPLDAAQAVPFESPPEQRVEVVVPNPVEGANGPRTTLVGMGIRRGVTLVVGGGYHGKSTLLRALERGVYPHIPGDGREYVVSDPRLVKIRAEDGRRVEQVDISAFIGDLPGGRSTRAFCSDDASGSTSQAANLVEAVEAGASGLLLDEDTCATNFMIRDDRMQALVNAKDEPITPYLERVRDLFDRAGVSTVLVMGGSGDYFDAADAVIALRDYRPRDATREAKSIAQKNPRVRPAESDVGFAGVTDRVPVAESFDPSRGRRDVKITARARDQLEFGNETIDLRGVEQLVDLSQTRAVGCAIHLATERFMDGRRSLREVLDGLDAFFETQGLDPLDPFHRSGQHPGNFARPRRFEIAAAVNRLRSVRMRQRGAGDGELAC